MFGLLLLSFLTLGAASVAAEKRIRREYWEEMDMVKAGKTIIKSDTATEEIYTFKSQQDAIEHPQEATFDPNQYPCPNVETVILENSSKHPLKFFNGKEFVTVEDSSLLTVTGENGDTTYVYLKFVQNPIRN